MGMMSYFYWFFSAVTLLLMLFSWVLLQFLLCRSILKLGCCLRTISPMSPMTRMLERRTLSATQAATQHPKAKVDTSARVTLFQQEPETSENGAEMGVRLGDDGPVRLPFQVVDGNEAKSGSETRRKVNRSKSRSCAMID